MLNRSLYRAAALVSILLLVASLAHAQYDPQRFECSGQPVGASCWMEASNQPGCYILNPEYQGPDETLTWTGECAAGLGEGTGTVTFLMLGRSVQVGTGRIQNGLWEGPWVWRDEAGAIVYEAVCGGSVCAERREASDEPAVVVEARETSDAEVFAPGCRTLRRGSIAVIGTTLRCTSLEGKLSGLELWGLELFCQPNDSTPDGRFFAGGFDEHVVAELGDSVVPFGMVNFSETVTLSAEDVTRIAREELTFRFGEETRQLELNANDVRLLQQCTQ